MSGQAGLTYELGCFAFVAVSGAMAPSALRMWRGQPNRIERGLKNAYGPLWINWARSLPVALTASLLFFGGGGLLLAFFPLIPAHHPHRHVTAGVIMAVIVALLLNVITTIGAVFAAFIFTTKWYDWPKHLIPPHLRDFPNGSLQDGA